MPIDANDYIVSSVRYNGTGSGENNIALKRISALDDASDDQIHSSYIVLANKEKQKNYRAKLGEIIDNLKLYAKQYTDEQTGLLQDQISTLETIVELIPKSEEIDSLIGEKIDLINSILETKVSKNEFETYKESVTNKFSEVDSKIDESINSFDSKLNESIGTLDSKIDESIGTLDSKIDESVGTLDSKLDESINSLDSKLDESINSLDSKLDESINSLDSKIDESIANNEEINNKFDNLNNSIDTLNNNKKDIIDELTLNTNTNESLQSSRLDDLISRVEYIEQYGGGGGGGQTPDPDPGTPTQQITYKFWLLSGDLLEEYLDGETFKEEFNDKFVASKVNGCPFTNEGYPALYWIKQKFGLDDSINVINDLLYLVIPSQYGKIRTEDDTVNINGKTLSTGVLEIHGNLYYKQNVQIEDIPYNIIKISNETSIKDGIKLKLI